MATATTAASLSAQHVGRLVRPEWMGHIDQSVYRVLEVKHDHGRVGLNLSRLGYAFEGYNGPDGGPALMTWLNPGQVVHVLNPR
jgi:hypothetical protein